MKAGEKNATDRKSRYEKHRFKFNELITALWYYRFGCNVGDPTSSCFT